VVSSRVYPGLERKPGGPDNWVERAGGLPDYIERIAEHLHYERGYSISRAIATAVNTVKRWARGGTVTKNGTTKHITAKTQALAAAAVSEWEAKRGAAHMNLAEPDISATACMVAFMIPEPTAGDIAVPGGTEAKDLHITLAYNGEVEDDDGYNTIVEIVRKCAADYGEALKGTIGGIGAFPAGDQGTPWLALVDVPGLSEFRYHLCQALQGSDYPANTEHGYTPHVTISYDDQPDPLPATPVAFDSVWVVRGNEQRTEIPLGAASPQAGADEPESATLPSAAAYPKEGKMELSAMIERARAISDPEQKARIRAAILDLAFPVAARKEAAAKGQTIPGTTSFPIRNEQDLRNAIQAFGRAKDPAAAKKHIISRARSLGLPRLIPKQWKVDLAASILNNVIDLALTKDGRTSFKNQGKWGHGFVPLDEKAKNSKAKGSSIARKRINRLFGNATKGVTAKAEGGGTVHATSAARLGGAAQTKDATASQRVQVGAKKEASKGGGVTQRAKQSWDQIPDDQKTVRNGKKYVVAIFGGKQQLTEWVGPGVNEDVKADPAQVRYASMTPGTAAKFSSGQLKRLLAVPGQPDNVKKILNAALKKAYAAPKNPVGV
jgi:2'-5' RNA ligase